MSRSPSADTSSPAFNPVFYKTGLKLEVERTITAIVCDIHYFFARFCARFSTSRRVDPSHYAQTSVQFNERAEWEYFPFVRKMKDFEEK